MLQLLMLTLTMRATSPTMTGVNSDSLIGFDFFWFEKHCLICILQLTRYKLK
jgi:hypothetical protein